MRTQRTGIKCDKIIIGLIFRLLATHNCEQGHYLFYLNNKIEILSIKSKLTKQISRICIKFT